MDALNILDPEDGPGRTPAGLRCWVVDVIGGAGGPNPIPVWQAFSDPGASSGAWVHPRVAALPPMPTRPIPANPVNIKPQQTFYEEFAEINRFYAALDGLQRPGGMVLPDEHGRMCADVEAMAAWGWKLMVGVGVEEVKNLIRTTDEWKIKNRRDL
jgi:hypothetical protein